MNEIRLQAVGLTLSAFALLGLLFSTEGNRRVFMGFLGLLWLVVLFASVVSWEVVAGLVPASAARKVVLPYWYVLPVFCLYMSVRQVLLADKLHRRRVLIRWLAGTLVAVLVGWLLYLALPQTNLFPVTADTNKRVRELEQTVTTGTAVVVEKIGTVEAKLDSTSRVLAENAQRDSLAKAAYEAAKKLPVEGRGNVDFSTYTECIRENNKLRQGNARLQNRFDSIATLHSSLPDRFKRRWARGAE